MQASNEPTGREYEAAYDVTFWGRRAFLEPLWQRISETPEVDDSLGWQQVLLDLLEEHGLKWREHPDPASGWPFAVHEDGMPPLPLSKLRAVKPTVLFGHSPFADRSNLGLKFSGTPDVALLLEVVATRVPGFADATVKMVEDSNAYEWWYSGGKVERSANWGVES